MLKRTKEKIKKNVQATYNRIANDFSQSRKKRHWGEFEIFEDKIKSGGNILDIGCGNGRFLEFLEGKNCKYIGIDNSEALIQEAKKEYPSNEFILGDFLDIPVRKGTQDTILCIASLHHVPSVKSRKEALKNIHEALKDNGTLIITVWNLFQPKYRKHLIKASFRWLFTLGNYHIRDTFIPWGDEKIPRYYHGFTPYEMKKLLKKTGFSDIQCHLLRGNKGSNLFSAYNQVYTCKK